MVDDSDQQSTCTPPPLTTLTGIRCSTAHITETDNAWLYSLSHQTSDFGESEWIHFTGSGYLLRTDAWSYPVLRLKRPLTGIRCSTAHITETDNAWLYSLSHQTSDFGESEWIHFTGSGYLLRTDAWSYPVLRLKRLGLSKTFRRLVVTLTRRYAGSGYLLRTDAWSYPVLRLKRLGLSKMFRRLVVTLIRRYGVSLIHLDASAECLPGLPTFNW